MYITTSDMTKISMALQSLEAMVKRYMLKAQRAAKFKDKKSRDDNINKALNLEQRIRYLRNG